VIKEPLDKTAKLNKKNALVNNRIKQSRYHHRHSKLIVLIVDDAVDNIEMIKGIIFEEYNVKVTKNAKAANTVTYN
jgi:response regulator RpfG family c-di-GMP phosphodiesterase